MLNFPFRTASLALGLLVASGAVAQQPAPSAGSEAPEDPVVARVGDSDVRLSDIEAAQQALPPQYREMPLPQIFPALRQQVVDTMLIAKAAQKAGVDREPDVERRLEASRRNVLREIYLSRLVDGALTEEAVRAEYEAMKDRLGKDKQVKASHILLRDEKAAKSVIEELAKPGADFAALARQHSIGPSKSRGGELGFFSRGDMVKPFSDAAFALKPGEVSKAPVRTQFGWHVIKVEDTRPAPVPTFEEAEEELRQGVARAAIEDFVADLRRKTEVQSFNMDGTPERPSGIRLAPR